MLMSFSVKNYKCFLNETTFSFKNGRFNIVLSENECENFTGKSTIISAMALLRQKILLPILTYQMQSQSDFGVKKINLVSSAMADKSDPSDFKIIFKEGDIYYKYIASFIGDLVKFESLSFSCDLDINYKTIFRRELNKKILINTDYLDIGPTDSISDNILLVSFVGILFDENKYISEFLSFFSNKLVVDIDSIGCDHFIFFRDFFSVYDNKNLLIEKLSEFNLNITDIVLSDIIFNKKKIDVCHSLDDGNTYKIDFFDEGDRIINLIIYCCKKIQSDQRQGILLFDNIEKFSKEDRAIMLG